MKQSLTDSIIVEGRVKHFGQTSLQRVLIAPHQTLLVVLIAREQGGYDFHHAFHTFGRKHLHQEEEVGLYESHVAIVGFLERSRKLLIFFWMVIVPTSKGKDVQFICRYLGYLLFAVLLVKPPIFLDSIQDFLCVWPLDFICYGISQSVFTIVK